MFCRATAEKDVRLKVLYCGVCHTDLHMTRNDWGYCTYPVVPGYNLHFNFILFLLSRRIVSK